MQSINVNAQQLEKKLLLLQEKFDLVGGTVVLFGKSGITQTVNFGNANLETQLPVGNQTMFRVASISKTITTIAFMQLVDQKKIRLDDDISKILGFSCRNPDYPGIRITPRMLLSHTSSLTDDPVTYDDFLTATYGKNPVPNLSEIMSEKGRYHSANLYLKHKPGTYFNYCNLNFGIIGTLIEKISGIRFDEYCAKNIFRPLGINATFNVANISDIGLLAAIYRKTEGNWIAQCDNFSGEKPNYENMNKYVAGTNAIRFAPQGGLRISASELAKIFMLFSNEGRYLNRQIISKTSLKEMMKSQWKFDGYNGDAYRGLFREWGLGIHLITNTKDNDEIFPGNVSMFGHAGDAYGLVSDAYIDKISGNGFVFITNGCGNGYTDSDCSSFYDVEKEVFDLIGNERKKATAFFQELK